MSADPLSWVDSANTWNLTRNSTTQMSITSTGLIGGCRTITSSLKTDNYTVLVTDVGSLMVLATDAKTWTLPAAAGCTGWNFTFFNNAATGAALMSVTANGTEKIVGTIGSVALNHASLANTKATQVKGDFVTLVCNGTIWAITGGVGIWAGT